MYIVKGIGVKNGRCFILHKNGMIRFKIPVLIKKRIQNIGTV